MPRVAIYPGSFDPITLGHVDIIRRSLSMFDEVVVGVARNISKSPVFSLEERIAAIRDAFPDEPRVHAEALDGLLVDYARARGCSAIVRGLRSGIDFEYEAQMTNMNRHLTGGAIETIFLLSAPDLSFTSSSLIKEIARFGGDFESFVTPHVAAQLRERLTPKP
jgi:pantetheine-phosphate adenylyltransferase